MTVRINTASYVSYCFTNVTVRPELSSVLLRGEAGVEYNSSQWPGLASHSKTLHILPQTKLKPHIHCSYFVYTVFYVSHKLLLHIV